jgi:putative endonuclease
MAEHNEIGKIGENLAVSFLMKLGFSVLVRNWRTRQGELDVVAQKDEVVHFIEVKTIKVNSLLNISNIAIQPEDNLTEDKWKKLILTKDSYLVSSGFSSLHPHQIDLACVYLDMNKREGRVKVMYNVTKE